MFTQNYKSINIVLYKAFKIKDSIIFKRKLKIVWPYSSIIIMSYLKT